MSDSPIDLDATRDELLDASRRGDTLGLTVEELEDLWVAAGERRDGELSEALGVLLDIAEERAACLQRQVPGIQPTPQQAPPVSGNALIAPSERLDEQGERENRDFMAQHFPREARDLGYGTSRPRPREHRKLIWLPRRRARGAGRPRRRRLVRRQRSGADPPSPDKDPERRRGAARSRTWAKPRRGECQGRRP